MHPCCDLEVDVNGQETFFVDKEILVFYAGRLRKLFSNLRGRHGRLKVIFHDFPGGAEAFELISKYCYGRGKLKISPSASLSLHFAAVFMEMNESNNEDSCLINQTREEYLKEIQHCPWSELVDCLKQWQEMLPDMKSSYMLQELLDCLVRRLSWPYISTPYTSSSDSSCMQFSGEISNGRTSNYSSQTNSWWFSNLDFLNIYLFEKVVKTMVAQKLDNSVISSFIFHYQKVKFRVDSPALRRKLIQTLIKLLCLLNRRHISVRGLFHILHCSLDLGMKRPYVTKLETLIASLLDQARLDDLLLPSPHGKSYAYDVNLIIKLQKQFLMENCSNPLFMYGVKKVAFLIDLYIAEVAPDPHLKPSKFMALTTILPDSIRDSHDTIYEAIDLYLKVHNNICQELKSKLCCVLNYDKLSANSLIHLAHNSNFPASAKVTAVFLPGKTHYEVFGDLKSCQKSELDFQTKDGRFRVLRPVEKVGRRKQTKEANIKNLSSICCTMHEP